MSQLFYGIASAVFCAAGFVSIAVADTSRQETNDRPPARAELSDTVSSLLNLELRQVAALAVRFIPIARRD